MIQSGTPEHVAAQIEAAVGFPVFIEADPSGMLISVTSNGCYGPGGAEGDLVLAQQVEAAIGQGAYVVSCGVVAWDVAS